MPDRVVLHVGMHKTGTTAIQNALSELGDGPGWEYLRFIHPNASNILHQAYAGRERPDNGLPQPSFASNAAEAQQLIETRLQAARAQTAIISGEGVSLMRSNALETLLEQIQSNVSGKAETEVFAYIRPPLSYLHAKFQTLLRGKFVPFGTMQNAKMIDYASRFQPLEELFSEARLLYRPYLVDRFRDRSVICDFADWLGIELPENGVTGMRANTALSSEAVKLLFIWRKKHPRIIPGDGRLIGALSDLKGPKLQFSEQVLAPVREDLSRQYTWSEARMGWNMAEPVAPDPPHAIRSEEDLLTVAPTTVSWLAETTGQSVQRIGQTPDDLIEAMAQIITPPPQKTNKSSLLQRAKRWLGKQ